MSIFGALSKFFVGAPRAEVDAANAAIRKAAVEVMTRPQSVIVDDVEPVRIRLGREASRAERRKLRYRDRNTKFGQRNLRITPRAQHQDVNNKFLNYVNHTLLHALLDRGGYFTKEVHA